MNAQTCIRINGSNIIKVSNKICNPKRPNHSDYSNRNHNHNAWPYLSIVLWWIIINYIACNSIFNYLCGYKWKYDCNRHQHGLNLCWTFQLEPKNFYFQDCNHGNMVKMGSILTQPSHPSLKCADVILEHSF